MSMTKQDRRSQKPRAISRNDYDKFLPFRKHPFDSDENQHSMLAKEGLMDQDSHNASKRASITKIPQIYASHRAQDYRTLQRFHSTEVEPILPPRIYA